MNQLRISLVQMDVHWEDKEKNLQRTEELLKPLAGQTDLILLPEMFATGFSMNVDRLAENKSENKILETVSLWSKNLNAAICGSFIAKEDNGKFYNRGFFITPEGENYFLDKRHLFRMGGEEKVYSSGSGRDVISYKGWNLRLAICYDLRFPVWLRNEKNKYDVLLFVANWPAARKHAWSTLLKARAIENVAYVAAVNRVGKDIHGNEHSGDSALIDYKGQIIKETEESGKEQIVTGTISLDELNRFRVKFPAWMDADDFFIQ